MPALVRPKRDSLCAPRNEFYDLSHTIGLSSECRVRAATSAVSSAVTTVLWCAFVPTYVPTDVPTYTMDKNLLSSVTKHFVLISNSTLSVSGEE